jgi:hypothetical protein
MAKPPPRSARDIWQRDLLDRWKQFQNTNPGGQEAIQAYRDFQQALNSDPLFIGSVKLDREAQARRHMNLVPPEARSTFADMEKKRAAALQALRVLLWLSKKEFEKPLAAACAQIIHHAAIRYSQHNEANTTKLQKISDCVIRSSQPSESAAICLRRLHRNLASSEYVWTKTWASMSPAAHEALALANPGQPVPLFGGTPPPRIIAPLLPNAIRFAGASNAKAHDKRDELLVAILIVYRFLSGQEPPISRSPNNATLKFAKSVEAAYKDYLPNGFNIPWASHSTFERLKKRSLRVRTLDEA